MKFRKPTQRQFFLTLSFFCFILAILTFICPPESLLIVLYNSRYINKEDFLVIKNYAKRYNSNIIDVKDFKSAADIYHFLKQNFSRYAVANKIKGVQIFGTAKSVPSFKFEFKCLHVEGGIDYGLWYWSPFISDFCYSNFAADASTLHQKMNIYDIINEKKQFSFIPQWQIARLPLKRGEYTKYIQKYNDFKAKALPNILPISAFVCSIAEKPGNPDDLCCFLKERLDKECSLLAPGSYRLFGNSEGIFAITSKCDGDYSRENIEKENKSGIRNIVIMTHGRKNRVTHSVTIEKPKTEKSSLTTQKLVLRNFLNLQDVNTVLKHNYYTLTAWSCWLARDLDSHNMAHEILTGQCIDVLGATCILANNDFNKDAPLEKLEDSNPFFFFLEFFKNLDIGYSRCESFFRAKASYASALLNHTSNGNYQYNLHNVLVHHFLGLI
ncbi:MAG: hypothetical protein LBJ83_02255 [Oscillospiraceae bacterium]|jgi:hypothetical protein|nr:hypothetical protein [Oscillospiraceae bacterium]